MYTCVGMFVHVHGYVCVYACEGVHMWMFVPVVCVRITIFVLVAWVCVGIQYLHGYILHVCVGLCVFTCMCIIMARRTQAAGIYMITDWRGDSMWREETGLISPFRALCEMNESHRRKVSPPALFDVIV